MWEVEKKVGKKKSEIEEKFNQKTLFDGSGASKNINLSAKSVLKVHFFRYFSYYEYHIFMTLKYFVKNKVIFIVSQKGKKDYCINFYMKLMLILTLANPARVSLFQ